MYGTSRNRTQHSAQHTHCDTRVTAHTLLTLVEPPFPLACSFLVPERGGAMSRSSVEPWIVEFHGLFQDHPRWSTRQPRWRLMEQLQDPRCGCTRPQAFNEAASRPPAVVDSSTALAFNEAGSRGWIDNLLSVHPKECERERTNSPGLFSAQAPRRSVQVAGAAAADDPLLGVGRPLTFLVDLRSAPATKQTQDTGRGACLTHSTTPMCSTRPHSSATA